MSRILFLVLCVFFVLGANARAIEIYVKGHKYNSIEEYIESKKAFAAMKSIPKNLPDALEHKLYVLSVEKGVIGALQDFYETWGQSDFPMLHSISSEQLQKAIQEAVTTSKEPKLLISEPGKVRIMGLPAGK